jgi:ferredoxin
LQPPSRYDVYSKQTGKADEMSKDQAQLPIINLSRCSRCGACSLICPTRVISEEGAVPYLAAPDRCTVCARCEEICPAGAINVPFEIGWAEHL